MMAQVRTAFSAWHSAYYQPGGASAGTRAARPAVLSISGWTDDLFPPVESFRMFSYLKSLDRDWPVAVMVGDVGHSRAQNPPAVWQAINQGAWTFLQANIAGSRRGHTAVSSYPTRCEGTATADDAISAPSPAALANGRLIVEYKGEALLPATAGASDPDGPATDAVAGGNIATSGPACRMSARLTAPTDGGYTSLSGPLPAEQTFVGIGHVQARYAATPGSPAAVLTARVWDVSQRHCRAGNPGCLPVRLHRVRRPQPGCPGAAVRQPLDVRRRSPDPTGPGSGRPADLPGTERRGDGDTGPLRRTPRAARPTGRRDHRAVVKGMRVATSRLVRPPLTGAARPVHLQPHARLRQPRPIRPLIDRYPSVRFPPVAAIDSPAGRCRACMSPVTWW